MRKELALLKLLEPIRGDNPSGKFLRYTETYDYIREARRKENDKLPQGVWKIAVKRADWERVSYLCQDALIHQTKDLQIAAWLTEAWLNLEGLTGLLKGLELVSELTKKFWKQIYPQMARENCELRIIPYEWMDSKLSKDLLNVIISAPSDKSKPSYTYIDYTKSNLSQPLPKPSSSQTNHAFDTEATFSRDTILLSMQQTPLPFYSDMEKGCSQALKTTHSLEKLLRSYLKNNSPNFSKLRTRIEALQTLIKQPLKNHGEIEDMKGKVPPQIKKTVSKSKRPREVTIKSREQAYQILGEVADYLERVEPHSPTPYLIHRAIAWGGMSLAEVVQDALQNGQDMSRLLDLLNVKKNAALNSLVSPEQ